MTRSGAEQIPDDLDQNAPLRSRSNLGYICDDSGYVCKHMFKKESDKKG